MQYEYINLDRLDQNCSSDNEMKLELLEMGNQSIKSAIEQINTFVKQENWLELKKVIHKLRPVLSYCGIIKYINELENIEKEILAENVDGIDEIIMAIIPKLETSKTEIENLMSSI